VTEAVVSAVCKSEIHSFSKPVCLSIQLIADEGVEGDAHSGKTVKHRSRVAVDPSQPNLRQIHLIHSELHEALIGQGFSVGPGIMGENITTAGIALLELPRNSLLHIGKNVIIQVTGLRNPCKQLDDYQKGLLAAVLERSPEGQLIRKSGIMAIVLTGGQVQAGDSIRVEMPTKPYLPLERV